MKKVTLNTILSLISTIDTPEADEVRAELNAELAKGKAKADANRAMYEELHDKVIEALRVANAPVTAQDIADATGIARGKVVNGLTKLWTAEVTVDKSGKANLYSLA